MNECILVADDDSNITDVCRRYLEREGYAVVTAKDGAEAIELWRSHTPGLIVLDLMMPHKNGWEVCNEIRQTEDVPIVMLTARGEEQDRLMGLTMGADDYLTKPFSPRELVLRVKAILRRMRTVQATPAAAPAHTISYEGLTIDFVKREVEISGQVIDLTVTEFDMLYLLASHPGQVFSRNQMLSQIWDFSYEGDTTTVTVHIRRLREKIEQNASDPKYIKTVWGIGYKFAGGFS
ncbi:response regulator transcription factor [Paenibacillus barcinonensis]|uniref:DNA-binding response OmpR family regulator n=1 Tax=Paenibacillus barcinonensis TaxID=198119 RepID=A0A2V4WEK6_PAEBA|nr:response regulator transcription factor [Paenibacillus barcinonensis]PYE50104.1 DNA-binding response OmpR family regulator [Paenibacillus barcinonensis]QKS59839.1 response regulator transcription factor [Paenibacillus barcinonensis]